MLVPDGFEGLPDVAVSPDIVNGMAQLDELERTLLKVRREELYSDISLMLGDAMLGKGACYEAGEPFTSPGMTIRALCEPTTKAEANKLSINVFSQTRPDEPTTVLDGNADRVLLRDYLVDIDHRTIRVSQATTSRRIDGRFAMDSKKPTLLQEGAEEMTWEVTRGLKLEKDLYSLPLLSHRDESRVLEGLVKLGWLFTATFRAEKALRIHRAENDVTY